MGCGPEKKYSSKWVVIITLIVMAFRYLTTGSI